MAASASRNESKITLEIRTKSVEQTLVPLVTQVRLTYLLTVTCVIFNASDKHSTRSYRPSGRGKRRNLYDITYFLRIHTVCRATLYVALMSY